MKTARTALLALCLSGAVGAQTEPLAEQIRLTQDAIRLAIQEMETLRARTTSSPDLDAKLRVFNASIDAELRAFEADVRGQILAPLQVLVGQYNLALAYRGESRPRILANLENQIRVLAAAKQRDYGRLVERLYAPLGDVPTVVETVYAGSMSNAYVESHVGGLAQYSGTFERTGRDCRYNPCLPVYTFTPVVNVVTGRGQVSALRYGPTNPDSRNMYDTYRFVQPSPQYGYIPFRNVEVLRPMAARATDALLAGCYSHTCFFQYQQHALRWATAVGENLTRPLTIRLAEMDRDVVIRPARQGPQPGPMRFVMPTEVLNLAVGGDVVLNLPEDVSRERLTLLGRIDAALAATPFNGRACRRTVAAARAELARLPDGALTAGESALFNHRANRLGADRAACLN